MRYKEIEELEAEKFRRLTGVRKATFERMVEILEEQDRRRKLEVAEEVNFVQRICCLMALEYMREYRTYFYWTKLWRERK